MNAITQFVTRVQEALRGPDGISSSTRRLDLFFASPWRDSVSLTLHTISVSAADENGMAIGPSIADGTSIGSGPRTLTTDDLEAVIPDELKFSHPGTAQIFAIRRTEDPIQAVLLSNAAITMTPALQEKVRQLLGWPDSKPLDLSVRREVSIEGLSLEEATVRIIRAEVSRYGFGDDEINKGVIGMIGWASIDRDRSVPPAPDQVHVQTLWSEAEIPQILSRNGVVEGQDAYVWRINTGAHGDMTG